MNVYVHEGNGHYIGSVVVVHAEDDAQAAAIVREYLDCAGLRDEAVNLKRKEGGVGIIYAQDGDY